MRFDEVVKKHGGEEKEKSSMRKAAGVMKRVIKKTLKKMPNRRFFL